MLQKLNWGGEPLALILADDVPSLSQMTALYRHYQSSIVAVDSITLDQSSSYGVVSGKAFNDRLTKMAGIIEKPSPKDAPSNLGLVGSYIFTPEIFSHIAKLNPGTGGELQLTDGIQTLLKEQLVLALQYEGVRYDCGNKLGYRKATINLALKHQELKEDFRMYLENRKN